MDPRLARYIPALARRGGRRLCDADRARL